jgi:hypothetical protein
MTYHLKSLTIRKAHETWRWNPDTDLGQVQKFTSLLYTSILSYYFMFQGYLWLTLYNCWVYISMPLVHISTKVVILIQVHGEVYLIQHYVKKFVNDLCPVYGFPSNFFYN